MKITITRSPTAILTITFTKNEYYGTVVINVTNTINRNNNLSCYYQVTVLLVLMYQYQCICSKTDKKSNYYG